MAMANKTALVLGIGLIFAGLFAFAIPGFAGMDLGAARSVALIVTGIVALGFGLFREERTGARA
jgi:uncharacterized membrane protein HdeD (DUF308 family)